jgi:uncharacterized protein YjbI with pentapeptide repeats
LGVRHDAAVVRERESRGAAGGLRMPFGWQLTLWLVLAVMVAAGAGFGLWWGLGSPDFRGGTLNPREWLELIKIALAVTGGIGGVVALVVAYRRQRINEAEHLREATKLFNERYTSAVDQLGSDKAAIRLGGVYAMAGLADDWEAGRQKCIDVLCAYLRMPYTPPVSPDDNEAREAAGIDDKAAWSKEQSQRSEERQVRHTVIRLIGDHLRDSTSGEPGLWRGHDFDFTGAVFDGGDFSKAVFSDATVSFIGAKFTSGTVHFNGAKFTSGTIDFSNAEFTDGNVNFISAQFTGGNINFWHAEFAGGTINFRSAEFTGSTVNFSYAEFSGSMVHFNGADFSGSTVDFNTTRFSGGLVTFFGARFLGGQVNFSYAEFSGGRVDLSQPALYNTPPLFSAWENSPPEGVLLPPTQPAASEAADEASTTAEPDTAQ